MKKSKLESLLIPKMVMLYLVITTISMISTTSLSYAVISFILPVLILFFLLAIMILLLINRIKTQYLIIIFLISIFMIYSYIISIIYGTTINNTDIFTTLALTIGGTYILINNNLNDYSKSVGEFFVIYCLVILAFNILIGGLTFEPFPRFNFEYISNQLDAYVDYSPGISQIFALGALAVASLTNYYNRQKTRLMLITLAMVFLILSLIGGSRGDSLAGVALIFIYFMLNLNYKFKFSFIVILAVFSILLYNFVNFEALVIFQRISDLSNNYGLRDVLFSQSINLLYENLNCLIFGCGFNFFQYYYQHPLGLYPHNILLELLITVGLPVTGLISYLVYRGFKIYRNYNKNENLIVLFFLFSLFVGFKSGSITSSWLLITLSCYFLSFNFKKI